MTQKTYVAKYYTIANRLAATFSFKADELATQDQLRREADGALSEANFTGNGFDGIEGGKQFLSLPVNIDSVLVFLRYGKKPLVRFDP